MTLGRLPFDIFYIGKKRKKFIQRSSRTRILKFNGVFYIEVPDHVASKYGKNREEFMIEHLHIFSKKSLQNFRFEYLSNKGTQKSSVVPGYEVDSKIIRSFFTSW